MCSDEGKRESGEWDVIFEKFVSFEVSQFKTLRISMFGLVAGLSSFLS